MGWKNDLMFMKSDHRRFSFSIIRDSETKKAVGFVFEIGKKGLGWVDGAGYGEPFLGRYVQMIFPWW